MILTYDGGCLSIMVCLYNLIVLNCQHKQYNNNDNICICGKNDKCCGGVVVVVVVVVLSSSWESVRLWFVRITTIVSAISPFLVSAIFPTQVQIYKFHCHVFLENQQVSSVNVSKLPVITLSKPWPYCLDQLIGIFAF